MADQQRDVSESLRGAAAGPAASLIDRTRDLATGRGTD